MPLEAEALNTGDTYFQCGFFYQPRWPARCHSHRGPHCRVL